MPTLWQPSRFATAFLVLLWSVAAAAQTPSSKSEPKSLALPPMPAEEAHATTQAPPASEDHQDSQKLKVRAEYDAAFQESLQKPSDPEVLAKFADLAVQVGDIEGAISALERLLLVDGDQPDVKLELGVLYYRLGSTEAARTYLEQARSSSQASNEVKERADTFLKAMTGH